MRLLKIVSKFSGNWEKREIKNIYKCYLVTYQILHLWGAIKKLQDCPCYKNLSMWLSWCIVVHAFVTAAGIW